jgi:hypothetical protein
MILIVRKMFFLYRYDIIIKQHVVAITHENYVKIKLHYVR